jgi:CBS domain-containing protein
MLQHSLSNRVADTLRKYAPFNLMTESDLLLLSQKVVIQYVAEDDFVFKQADAPKSFFFFIKEGSIKLFKEVEEKATLHNQCDEGDCFGVRQIFADENYWFNAQAAEETLLYAIPIAVLKDFLPRYPKMSFFLAQIFSTNIQNATEQIVVNTEVASDNNFPDIHLSSILTFDKIRNAVTCSPSITIQTAAKMMTQARVSSIIVINDEKKPIGIISDSTIRRCVTVENFDNQQVIEKIMTKPVACTKAGLSLADIQIQMIQKKVRYLCITEDGSDKTPLQGIVSEHDLIIAHGNNPAVLFREIQNAETVPTLQKIMQRVDVLLANYLNMEVSAHFVANLIAELNDAFTRKAIEMSIDELSKSDIEKPQNVNFCWLTLGSGGRREQLKKTDQDNALIFSDVRAEDFDATHQYFLMLAKKVTDIVHAGGFAYCTGEMMASNPLWCQPISHWQKQFRDWMDTPDTKSILQYKIFFDYRPVFGDENLAQQLTDATFEHLESHQIFLTFMAKDAAENPPPLSFFRNLIVEKNGEHKDQFNIKARGLTPIADLVRALVLGAGIKNVTNTIQRLEALSAIEPQNKELYQNVAKSYETILKFRAQQAIKNNDSGKYISPQALDKLDRLLLRRSFRPIEDLQTLVTMRFAISNFSL